MTPPTDPAARSRRPCGSWPLIGMLTLAIAPVATAGAAGERDAYLAFIRARAAALRAGHEPPRSLAEWTGRRAEIRRLLARALGPVPDSPAPLDPMIHGTLDRDG